MGKVTPTYDKKKASGLVVVLRAKTLSLSLSLLSRNLKVPTSFFSYTQHLAVNERIAEDDDNYDDDCVVIVLVLVLVPAGWLADWLLSCLAS